MRLRPLLCALLVVSCNASLEVPPGTTIACSSNADCPSPRVCAVDLAICISAGESAERPAVVGTAAVSPALVGATTTVDITFIANKVLGSSIVTITWPTGETENAKSVDSDDTTKTYHYQFNPTPGKTPEGSASVTIEVHDISGRVAYYAHPTPLTFDFVPPVVTFGSVSYQKTTLRPDLSAAAEGASIVVRFTSSEALDASTRVTAGDVSFNRDDGTTTSLVYSRLVDGSTAEGTPTVHVDAYDLAGNLTPADFAATIAVDRTSPALVDTATPGKVVFTRVPWGSASTSLTPSFTVTGQAASVEGGALVQLLDRNDGAANVLGQGTAGSDGAFGPIGVLGDYSNMWIRALDGGGNTSPIGTVSEGTWTATFNQKDPRGVSLFNPNTARIYPQTGAGRTPSRTEALTSVQIQSLAEPSNLVHANYKRVWLEHGRTAPTARFFHASAYDPVRDTLVLFGGASGSDTTARLNDTWTWDGVQYEQRATSSTAPPARWGHSMVYDGVRDSILMFGGNTASGPSNDTWEWDGNAWTQLEPDTDIPEGRFLQTMASDPENGTIVLFGGCRDKNCTQLLNDTWTWDGLGWSEVTPGSSPTPRAASAMTYNAGLGGVVLQDGCDESNNLVLGSGLTCDHGGNPDPDTWLWRKNSTSHNYEWVNITTASEPSYRAFHALVTTQTGALVVVGGCSFDEAASDNGACTGSGEVYCRQASGWTLVGGSVRSSPGAAIDRTRAGIVVHGGFSEDFGEINAVGTIQLIKADCSTASETRPAPDPAAASPLAKQGPGLVYIPASAASFLFAGGPFGETRPTWLWTGTSWIDTSTSSTPSARQAFGSALDTARNKVVMFGGASGGSVVLETYEITPSAFQSWAAACTTTGCRNSIPARAFHGMATGSGGRPIVFGGGTSTGGGVNLSDLWSYNGSQWTALCTTCTPRPSARRCPAIAYDSVRGKVVMFGGTTETPGDCDGTTLTTPPLNDTWEYDVASGKWASVCTSGCTPPVGRVGHALVYDSARAHTVLIGGAEDGVIYEWDGSQWRTTTTNGPVPLSRHSAGVTYEPARAQVLMYSGRNATTAADPDTWTLDLASNGSTGVGADFAWGFANITNKVPDQLTIRATAGARGYTLDATLGADADVIGEASPGAAIEIWNWVDHVWTRVVTNAADITAPTDLTYQETNATNVSHFIGGASATIYVRLVNKTTNGNGPAPASVAVDYLEATVHYRGQ